MNVMLGHDDNFLLSDIDMNKDVLKLVTVEEGSIIEEVNPLNYVINKDTKGLVELTPGPSVLDYVKSDRNSVKIPVNVITSLIALLSVECKVIFKHSDIKMRMSEDLHETHYFREHETVNVNKTIVKNLSEIKIHEGSIKMEYTIDGFKFYYELVKLTKSGPKVNEFYIELGGEDFEKVKDRICYETADNVADGIRIRLATYRDGQDLLEFPMIMKDYFIPICSSVFEKLIQLNTDLTAKEIVSNDAWRNKLSYDKWKNKQDDEEAAIGISIEGERLKVKMPLFKVLSLKDVEFQEFSEFLSLSSLSSSGVKYSSEDKIAVRPDEFKAFYAVSSNNNTQLNLNNDTQLSLDKIIESIKLEILKWKMYYLMIVQAYTTALNAGFKLWVPVSDNAYLVNCEVVE